MSLPRVLQNRYYSESDSDGHEDDCLTFTYKTGTKQSFSSTTPATSSKGGTESAPKKYYCGEEECGLAFPSEEAFHEHLAGASARHKYCTPCHALFKSFEELQAHLIRSPGHIVCVDCFKEFKSEGGLSYHKRMAHPQNQPLPCPACKRVFASASGISQHIETHGCPGISPESLQRKIVDANDALVGLSFQTGVLPNTTTTHLWRDGIMPSHLRDALQVSGMPSPRPAQNISVLDYTPPPLSKEEEPIALKDMKKHWNPNLRAYICPHAHCVRKFREQTSILQHLQSGVHSRKIYRCPSCQNRFGTPSSLLQHVESSACKAGTSDKRTEITNNLTGGIVISKTENITGRIGISETGNSTKGRATTETGDFTGGFVIPDWWGV